MTEGAALDIFTGEPDRDAVGENRGHRQLFGSGPVDAALRRIGEDRLAPFAPAFELAVHDKAFGHLQQVGVQFVEPGEGQGGLRVGGGTTGRHRGHRLDVILLGLDGGIGLFERGHALAHHLVGALLCADAGRHQRLGVLLADGGMRADHLIDRRLRERRLVAFVVAIAAVADQVDQVIELETLAVGNRQPCRLDARDRIVGVDVRNRNLEAARQAAGVAGAERLFRVGREPDLVVGNDVDDAADVVAFEPRQVQRLGDDALSGESSVAMDQDREHLPLVDDRGAGLVDRGGRRARHAVQHRVHRFEVARVGRH